MKQVTIHTDGGCRGNPGPGGWAAVLRHQKHLKEISGGETLTTNNRMELRAAIEALATLNQPCAVICHTDSEYVRKGITSWLKRWKLNGWRTTDRQPVRNADLWQRLEQVAAPHRIEWRWVKGHAGHRDNERCDTLAGQQMDRLRRPRA